MKRKHSDGPSVASKRQRILLSNQLFDDTTLANCICKINDPTTAVGYLNGIVRMRWPISYTHRTYQLYMQCRLTKGEHIFDVNVDGQFVHVLEASGRGMVDIEDQVWVSLDGLSSVRNVKKQGKPRLTFLDGIMIRWVKKNGETHSVNTWKETEDKEDVLTEHEDFGNWFATPAKPVSNRLSLIAKALSESANNSPAQEDQQKLSPQAGKSVEPPPRTTSPVQERSAIPLQPSLVKVQETPAASVESNAATTIYSKARINTKSPDVKAVLLSKRAKKKLRKEAKRQSIQNIGPPGAAATSGTTSIPTTVITPSILSQVTIPSVKNDEAIPQVIRCGDLAPTSSGILEDTPTGWLVKLQKAEGNIISIKEADEAEAGRLVNVIGVVKSITSPEISRLGDLYLKVFLVDPSTLAPSDGLYGQEFTLIYFARKHREWLPCAEPGDVLIARDIRTKKHFNGNNSAVGHHDRARWAVYSPSQGCIRRPELGSAPEAMVKESGLRFSSFHKPSEEETRYCIRLSEWWKEMHAEQQPGQVYNLGREANPTRTRREHRLICDAGPDVEPDGYFDCTVEVLQGFQNDNEAYTLYVTDYTKNDRVASCQAKFCPSGLNEYVIGFECWDAAAGVAKKMKPGSFYVIENVRMRLGRGGFVEGKVVQKKIMELDPEKASGYPHLRALLERKKTWRENLTTMGTFQHKLIEDAQDGGYFNCTVELLNVEKSHGETYIHVTDYTSHPKLSDYRYKKQWSENLEGRIVGILLRDVQSQCAENLTPGSYLAVTNLRMQYNPTVDRFQGELGGSELLIKLLNPTKMSDNLEELLRRKEKWNTAQHRVHKSPESRAFYQPPPKPKSVLVYTKPTLTVKQIQAITKEMFSYRMLARVIDYNPTQLSECFHTWCSQCDKMIPTGRRACTLCMDMDHEYVQYKILMILRLEDASGDQMDVQLNDESDILKNVEKGDPSVTPSVVTSLKQHLRPLIGETAENGKLLPMITGAYKNSEGHTTHVLLDLDLEDA